MTSLFEDLEAIVVLTLNNASSHHSLGIEFGDIEAARSAVHSPQSQANSLAYVNNGRSDMCFARRVTLGEIWGQLESRSKHVNCFDKEAVVHRLSI